MFSFVLEVRFGLETRNSAPSSLWNAVQIGAFELESKLKRQISQVSLEPLRITPPCSNSLDLWLKDVLSYLVTHQTEVPDIYWELTSLFFLHIIILPNLSVSERARQREDLNGDLVAMLVETFLPQINAIMAAFVSKTNRFIDVDGRIFISILSYTISNGTNALSELVGTEISSRLETMWSSANAPPPDFARLWARFPNCADPHSLSTASDEEARLFTLLPFRNAIFDEELAVVRVTVSDRDPTPPPTRLEFSQGILFSDTKHWHDNKRDILPKHLGGDGVKDVDECSRKRQLRRTQRFMLHVHRLSVTLTGASGKVLQRTLVPPTGRKVANIIDDFPTNNRQQDKKVRQRIVDYLFPIPVLTDAPQRTEIKVLANQQKKVKPATLSGRDRIRQEHAREKKAKADRSSQEWWLEQLRQVEQMASYEEKMNGLRGLLRNPRAHTGWLSVEVQLYNLHLTIQQWIAERDREDRAIHDRCTVSIMRVVKELYASDSLTETTLGVLASVMAALGFIDHIAPLEDEASQRLRPDRDLSFKFIKLLKSKSNKPIHKFMAIRESPVIWQLRVFGDYMDRSMDSAPDPRVGFQPDAWQREVLDCLDEPKRSLLVVGELFLNTNANSLLFSKTAAPTSAGKTFISFYAMEKVLRESDDGIIVYVAPAKALVNQVAAEVYARFRKEVDGREWTFLMCPKGSLIIAGTCWSVKTRDYHMHDIQKCQILITVPDMLAIMLLSPPFARTWTPRIRR